MAKYGFSPGASIYIADSAFVTTKNLAEANRNNIRFLSRLPVNFSECKRVISQAVSADEWQNTIEETVYRSIVLHSSAYDKRRQKRIDGMIKNSKEKLRRISGTPYY